jgi:hypothetical protein
MLQMARAAAPIFSGNRVPTKTMDMFSRLILAGINE